MNPLFSVYEHDKAQTIPCKQGGPNSWRTIHPNMRILTFINWLDEDISVGSRVKIFDEIYTIIGKSFLRNWYGGLIKASLSVVKD